MKGKLNKGRKSVRGQIDGNGTEGRREKREEEERANEGMKREG